MKDADFPLRCACGLTWHDRESFTGSMLTCLVGRALSLLLAKIGVTGHGCPCRATAASMDSAGCDAVEESVKTWIDKLETNWIENKDTIRMPRWRRLMAKSRRLRRRGIRRLLLRAIKVARSLSLGDSR